MTSPKKAPKTVARSKKSPRSGSKTVAGRIYDLQRATASKSPLQVGNSVLIRTVTYFQLGKVVELSDTEVVLEDASWVADTGRFGAALKSGVFSEVEVFPELVSVARGSIVDVTKWPHSLPR